MTILVAAEQQLRDALLPVLARKGYALVFVEGVYGIGQLVGTHPFDLIIVDLDALAKDSLTTSTELKRVLERVLVPIIVVENSRAMRRLRALASFLRQRATVVLDKPLDMNQLEREVARALGDTAVKPGCLTENTVSRLVDGELSQEEADRVHDHLARCETCAQRFEEWKKADDLFRSSFRTVMMTRMHSSKACISPRRLTAYFRGALPAAERAEVEAHLSRCAFCTRELVALYKLMKDFDDRQLEPLGEEMLHRLKSGMRELLRKAKGPLICIQCVGSIPLGSEACPECGAIVRGSVPQKILPAEKQIAEGHDGEGMATRPNGGYVGSRKAQVAASLIGLLLITAAVLAGIVVNQNRDLGRSGFFAQTGEESCIAALLENQIEEKIEVFGQIASYEPRTRRFDVPDNVARIARALVAQQYYDAATAEKALQHDDIWHVFTALNSIETGGSTAPLLPKTRNRILGPDHTRILKCELSGNFSGIGVIVQRAPGGIGQEVLGFRENSPAEQAGLRVGDIITEVDGTALRGLDLTEMTALVRGPVGSTAKLKVTREALPEFELRVARSSAPVYVVKHIMIDAMTAHLLVNPVTRATPEKLKGVLTGLSASGVKNLVLDLRDNTGGSVQAALDIASLFLPEGAPIARIRGRSGEKCLYSEGEAIWEGQLAVVVDSRTLSAAELVAAALQGNGRALIVGETTAGKASIQSIFTLSEDYAVQLTTDVLAGADGLVFENCGVEPDIEVVGIRDAETSKDAFVQAALRGLESGTI